jgi:hypothetical protein
VPYGVVHKGGVQLLSYLTLSGVPVHNPCSQPGSIVFTNLVSHSSTIPHCSGLAAAAAAAAGLPATVLQYTAGSPGYKVLAKEIEGWEHQPTNPAGRLFYLALPPYVYPEVRPL